jgi:hypothetical protein
MWFTIAARICGAFIIVFTLRQIFHDLFHPSAQSSLSDFIASHLWRLMRKSRRLIVAAGPIALITVIAGWVALMVIGFTLVYWPGMPGEFQFQRNAEHGFVPAFCFSFQSITTLAYGDVRPGPPWLRVVAALEAMVGLMVVSAAVSWTVLLYPALSRMRVLARRTILLAETADRIGVDPINRDSEIVIQGIAVSLVETRVDLIYFPIIYYFQAASHSSSLAKALPHMARFADLGSRLYDAQQVRLGAEALYTALDDIAEILKKRFIDSAPDDRAGIFKAYAVDHREC